MFGQKALITYFVVAVVLTMIGGSYYLGRLNTRNEAVDAGAASYKMVDQYGHVAFLWDGQKLAQR